MSTKKIPGWYRVYLEKKLIRLEIALRWINLAEKYNERLYLNIAKNILNQ